MILSLETFLGSVLCNVNLGRTLKFLAPLEIVIKDRFPDLPGNISYGTNSNP